MTAELFSTSPHKMGYNPEMGYISVVHIKFDVLIIGYNKMGYISLSS